MQMGRDIGKISAVAGTCDGFAANRSRAPFITEMMLMLEEGALPEQIDKVMVDFGYPLGPFAVNDISGLDISYDTRKRRAAADPNYRKLHVPDRLVEMGRKGQKTGAGWYRYEKGDRTPHPDEVVKSVIAEVAKEFGIEQRTFTDDEILRRLLLASVNEACKILEEGKAYRASDIDVMWLHGFGFPRYRGGLMFWADTVGVEGDPRADQRMARALRRALEAERSAARDRCRWWALERRKDRELQLGSGPPLRRKLTTHAASPRTLLRERPGRSSRQR